MKIFELTQTDYDLQKKKQYKVADWTAVTSGLHNDKIIIQKIPADYKPGMQIKKVFRVENDSEYTFKAMKTKIKANGGADGLLDFMIKENDTFYCRIINLLNYAWDEMRYEYL